ncbi:hypothetical protein BSU04_11375 [Caballeronia sordidicola]|uniref:Uncharacterized protein n=1 Tax=Caballeronia sordidicola TaxID=196367 RepID=A0A226X5C3_CABSO|nr:hypothetical protein BSU04_11375 [Caballeronia sordidicola]
MRQGLKPLDAKPRTHAALVDASVNGQKSKEETQLRFDTLIS